MVELFQTPAWIILIFVETLAIIVLAVFLQTKHNNRNLLKEKKEYKIFVREMIYAFAKCIDIKDEYIVLGDENVLITKKDGSFIVARTDNKNFNLKY